MVLARIECRDKIKKPNFKPLKLERKMNIKQALFSSEELLEVDNAEGRILSSINVSCPPAVPIVISGEVIDENAISVMKYYGVEKCFVVKEK
jgi:arginine/lysine/ornithine decarboxylase